MTVEERIQTIRVWNLIQKHPDFAKEAGLIWYVTEKTEDNAGKQVQRQSFPESDIISGI